MQFQLIIALLLTKLWCNNGFHRSISLFTTKIARFSDLSMNSIEEESSSKVKISTLRHSIRQTVQANTVKTAAITSALATFFLQSPSSTKAEEVAKSLTPFLSLDCDDSIIVFQQPTTDRVVVMIGTAHISEESVNVVRRTIQRAQPDTVMIELDTKRIARADVDSKQLQQAGFILPKGSSFSNSNDQAVSPALSVPKRKSLFDSVVRGLVAPVQQLAQAAAGAALGKVLGSFYKSVEKLGFSPGGEFKAAVEEGRKLQAKILLGDRDVDITLERLATAISQTNPDKLSSVFERFEEIEKNIGIDTSSIGEDVTKEELGKFVESIKQKQFIIQLMNVLKAELPDVYSALVGERDEFMANSVLGADSSKVLVGVVGLAHLAGTENYLKTKGNFKSIQRNCPQSY